ncbi:MAG: flagellar filament capping protein FliD [Syntrophorhabdales bacterium]
MSTTSPTSSMVNLTGIVSNTDWQSLVSQIISEQKTAAETSLKSDLTSEQNLLSAWQSFNTTLSALTNYISTNNLNADSGYQAFTGSLTCSDSSITPSNVLSASTGTGTIAAGTYSIEVSRLAAAEKIASDQFSASNTALGLSGDLLVNGKDVSIGTSDTLSDIVTKINSAGAGVNASLLNTGTGSVRMTIESSGQGSSGMTIADGTGSTVAESLGLLSSGQVKNLLQAGQDASLTVDGYAVTSPSNTVTGVIPGVILTLTGTNPSSPIVLNITQDTSALSTNASTLVTDLNNVLSYINSQNTYNSSSASSASNALMGNPTLYGIKNTINGTLLGNIQGNSTYTTAASIGIKFGPNGAISLDTNTFSAALSANPTEVINAVKSISASLYTALNAYVDPTTGVLTSLQGSINDKITEINTQLQQVDDRCAQQAQVLENEYNQLEVLIQQSNLTKTWLTDEIDVMTNTNNSTSGTSSF